MAIFGARLTGAGIGGLVKLGRHFPWTVPVAAVLAVIAGQRLWRVRADLRSGAVELLEQLRPHVRRILDDMAEYAELRADLVTVHDPPWRAESFAERCPRTLARSRDPLTPSELRDVMGSSDDEHASAAGLRRIMRAYPAFIRLPGDVYQVRRAVTFG